MDILEDMKKQAKLVYDLQILCEQIVSMEHNLELLKDRRTSIFVEMRSLSDPVSYDEIAHITGMSTSRVHRLTKQAKQNNHDELQRKIADGSAFGKDSGLTLQEQVELYNSQRPKD